jgi:hypothetical protein
VTSRDSSDQRTDKNVQEALFNILLHGHESNKKR